MTITDFIKGNVILVAIVIVIFYFIIRYLYSKGYFDKFGIKDIKLTDPTNNSFFDPAPKSNESKEDFFATGPIKSDEDYFDTKNTEIKDVGKKNFDKDKKWFEEKK